ncbi:MAG: FkbM family methyltransferase [Nanoarchaeota archaeon]|nr:FkbM family methyltransferase [Nanoarchaeota archaeon]
MIDKLRQKWIQYNDFTLREIIKLLNAKISGRILLHCAYCMIAQRIIREPIKTVIDIGAYDGEYSKCAKYVLPSAKIYAFEPTEICKKISGRDITAFNFGLWDKTGKGVFYQTFDLNTGIPCCDSSFFKTKDTKNNEGFKKVIIERKRFDGLDIKIERPCFVKVDAEGAEYEVLKGFGNKLKEVDVIQLEYLFEENYSRQNFIKIIQLLNKYNFHGFFQPITTWPKGKLPQSNDWIFFKYEK